MNYIEVVRCKDEGIRKRHMGYVHMAYVPLVLLCSVVWIPTQMLEETLPLFCEWTTAWKDHLQGKRLLSFLNEDCGVPVLDSWVTKALAMAKDHSQARQLLLLAQVLSLLINSYRPHSFSQSYLHKPNGHVQQNSVSNHIMNAKGCLFHCSALKMQKHS